MSINVTLIEDHRDFRDGLSFMINNSPGFKCIGAYDSMEDAIRHDFKADLILLDIGLPGKSGTDGIVELRRLYPDTQIVMLTGMDDDQNILRAILAGANGYLLKKTAPSQLLSSMKDAIEGGMPMTPSIAYKVVQIFKKYVPDQNSSSSLTKREKEILTHLVEGFNYKEISQKLYISIDTVRNHIRHIYEKLQVHSKSQAVAKALKEGLI